MRSLQSLIPDGIFKVKEQHVLAIAAWRLDFSKDAYLTHNSRDNSLQQWDSKTKTWQNIALPISRRENFDLSVLAVNIDSIEAVRQFAEVLEPLSAEEVSALQTEAK